MSHGGERCRRLARACELLIWRLAEAESTRACFVHCAALGRAGRWQGNWGPICGAEGGVRPPTLPNERLRRPRGTHFAAARCSGARERPLSGAQCSSERLLGRYGSSACGGSCLCLWMVEYKRCLLESSTGSEQLHHLTKQRSSPWLGGVTALPRRRTTRMGPRSSRSLRSTHPARSGGRGRACATSEARRWGPPRKAPRQLDAALAAVSSHACSGIVPCPLSRSSAETLDAATVRGALQVYLAELGSEHQPSDAPQAPRRGAGHGLAEA